MSDHEPASSVEGDATMRYEDGPTTEAQTVVNAPIEVVWSLITDIDLPARFSSEFQGAEWVDEGPALGARFTGRNQHAAIGDWQTTCTVTRYSDCDTFEWAVGDPDQPSARWTFTLEPGADGVVLRQRVRIGPAPSGLTPAIEAMPDKEERIIARRLSEHQANMQAIVDGVKHLAENSTHFMQKLATDDFPGGHGDSEVVVTITPERWRTEVLP